MSNSNSSKLTLIPVMITFFTMGFVDLVGAVSNNMQEDFGLSDSAANFFPSRVLLVPDILRAHGHAYEQDRT